MVRSKSNTTSLTFPSADASSRVPSLADASASDVEDRRTTRGGRRLVGDARHPDAAGARPEERAPRRLKHRTQSSATSFRVGFSRVANVKSARRKLAHDMAGAPSVATRVRWA